MIVFIYNTYTLKLLEKSLKWIRSTVIYYLKTFFGIKCLSSILSILTYIINRYNLIIDSNDFTLTLWIWTTSIFFSLSIIDAPFFIKKYYDLFRNIKWETIPEKYDQLKQDMNVSINKFGYNKKIRNAFYFDKSIVVGTKLKELLNEDEELAIIAHEFAHNIWAFNFLHYLLSIVLMIGVIIGTLSGLIILTALTDIIFMIPFLFLLFLPINWKREKDADMKATDFVEVEHLKHALIKLKQGNLDIPTWTHPPIRKRIEWLDKKENGKTIFKRHPVC